MSESKKLFVGVPIYGSVDYHYHCAMGELRQCNQANGMIIYEHCGDSLVSRARNHITRMFLESDATHLLFIDSDLVFDLRQIVRIMEHEEDLVAGVYFKKSEGEPQMVNNLFPVVKFREDGLMEGKYAGTGFMRICRRVFELMIQEFGRDIWYMLDPDHKQKEYDFWHCGIYEYPDGLRRYLSEDWWFPVDPSTPILGADWKWKPIGDFNAGEKLIAFDENSTPNSSRRFCYSDINHIIDRRLPLWKITHEEGEIITTSEHPWLSKHSYFPWSWCPTENLKNGDMLSSVVPVAKNPDIEDSDYLAGYIQGLFQSDGTISASQATVRMKDVGPLNRLSRALSRHGIECVARKNPQHDGNPKHSPTRCVGVYRKTSLLKLNQIASQSSTLNCSFSAGYLAGMYDGDGNYSGGVASIYNLKDWKRQRGIECGKRIGVSLKERGDKKGIRVTNLNDCKKFWMSTLPANERRTNPTGQPGNDGIVRMAETKNRPVRILNVESLGKTGDVRCVGTTSRTFIANGFASHNCQKWLDIGGKLWIDRNIVLKHSGQALYPLSYQDRKIFNRPSSPVVGGAVEQPAVVFPAAGELSPALT